MEDLSDFERGQIIGAHLAEASTTKLPHYWVYREQQFLRLSAYTNHRKSTFKEEQWAKINIDRKRLLYMRIVLKNHTLLPHG
jgi:hypothetical protein